MEPLDIDRRSVQKAAQRPDEVPRYSWYALALLTFGLALACADRYSFNIVIEPMKRDLGATDTQMGLLSGAAFILFYVGFGVPLGRLVDRGNRSIILSVSVAVWSVMTVLTGFSANVLQAALARIGLGVAEAASMPASLSLISNLFPRSRQAFAASIYQSAMPLSMIFCGLVFGSVAQAYGWRVAMWMLAAPGFLLGPLMYFTLREPRRAAAHSGPDAPPQSQYSFLRDCKALFGDVRFALLFVSQLFVGIAGSVIVAWYAAFLMRAFAIDVRTASFVVGIGFGSIMLVAYLGVGFVTSRLISRTGRHEFGALVPAWMAILAGPLGAAMLMARDFTVSIIIAALFFFTLFASRPAGNTLVLEFVAPEQRGLAVSLILVATNLIGSGAGPVFVGLISDQLSNSIGPTESLRWALMSTVPVEVFLSGLAFLGVSRAMARSRPEAEPAPA